MLMLGCKELKQISYLPYKACPPCCSPYIPYGADQENLSKKIQCFFLSLTILSFILVTLKLDIVGIL